MPARGTRIAAQESLRLVFGLKQARGYLEQTFALRAEAHPPRFSFQKVDAAGSLQLPHMGRKGGLADRHVPRGLRKAARLRDDVKGLQLRGRHGILFCRRMGRPYVV
ncbi:hypothetical protein D3C86_1954510 [compost metagenome]